MGSMPYRVVWMIAIGIGLLCGLSACGSATNTPATPATVTATMTATPVLPLGCLPYGSYIRDTPTPRPTLDPARSRWMCTPWPVTATPTRDPLLPTVTATPTPTPIPPTCSRRPEQPTLTATPTGRPTVAPAVTQGPVLLGGGGHTVPQNLSAELGFDFLGAVAVDRDGRGHAVWAWWAEDFWAEARSYYMGTDGWGGWQYRSGLARNCAKNKGSPAIAVGADGRTLYVAYGDGLGDQVRVYVRYSTDRGATWSPPEAVTAPPAAYPSIQVDDDGQVHVLYRAMACSGDPDDEETVCTFRQEHVVGHPGEGWSVPTRVVAKGGDQIHSDLLSTSLLDGTRRTFAIVAVQYEGVFVTYQDGGEGSWSAPLELSHTAGRSPQNIQSIAFDHGEHRYVYVCWEIYAQSGFSCAWTTDGGASWSYQLVVPPTDGGGKFHISSPAPLYDMLTGRLWLLYSHVVWSPRRGYIGVMGVTPGETDWFPQVPGAEEVAVLSTNCQEARIVTAGYRNGLMVYPVLWQEHCPENAGALEIYAAFVVPSQWPLLWKK